MFFQHPLILSGHWISVNVLETFQTDTLHRPVATPRHPLICLIFQPLSSAFQSILSKHVKNIQIQCVKKKFIMGTWGREMKSLSLSSNRGLLLYQVKYMYFAHYFCWWLHLLMDRLNKSGKVLDASHVSSCRDSLDTRGRDLESLKIYVWLSHSS